MNNPNILWSLRMPKEFFNKLLKSVDVQQYRQKVGAAKFDEFVAKNGWLDPGKFVSHSAPASVFLQ